MPFRVFISSSDDPQSQQYLAVARRALFHIDEDPLSVEDERDLTGSDDRIKVARELISQSEIFMGIYGAEYGEVPSGETRSYSEQEYHLAVQMGKQCLIFRPETFQQEVEERQQAFFEYLEQQHIINEFDNAEDLAAQIKLQMDKYRETRPLRRLRPPQQNAFPPAEAEDDSQISITVQSVLPPAPQAPPAPAPQESVDGEDRRERMVEPEPAAVEEEATGTSAPPEPAAESYSPGYADPDALTRVVNRALQLAEDELEAIVRRALQLHEAQTLLQRREQDEARDGLVTVAPIFGEPNRGSQFQADIFMVMPFRERYNAVYSNIIQPLAADLNLTIKRGDDFTSVTGAIMQEVWAALNACRVVIADTSEDNPNVYYELGIAHTLGKPAILLTQAKDFEQIPFDIRHLRFIVYEDSIPGAEKLEQDLRRAIVWLLNDLDENGEQ